MTKLNAMKKINFGLLIVSLTTTMACNDTNKEAANTDSATETNLPVSDSATFSSASSSTPSSSDAAPASASSAPSTMMPAAAPVQGTASATGTTPEGMNPPHGEPGHRCDIAVGAPLNSAPAPVNQGAPQIQQAPATTISTPAVSNMPVVAGSDQPGAAKTPTPAGMNPPHGEPGHDCAIPVGSPLPKK